MGGRDDAKVQIAWAPSGEFLAVVVARYPKKRGKNLTYQISVVRVKERNAPSDVSVSGVADA